MKVSEADLQDILKAYGQKTRPPKVRRNSKKKDLSTKTIEVNEPYRKTWRS